MKKINITSLLIISSIFVSTMLISYSCKKDRIQEEEEEEETVNEYESINSYLDSKKQQEQDYTINGPSNDTLIGQQGTRVFGSKNCLRDSNGDTIDYPFNIKLVELYTPKDMIYYQMPTVAGGEIMKTDGEIRIRAFKGTEELTLACPYRIDMPNSAPSSGMTVFTGADNGSFVDWSNSSIPFAANSYGYTAYLNSLGWVNCGKDAGTAGGYKLTFSSTTDDLTNVGIFIYMPATKTVMQVYNLVSGDIPSGTSVKIVVMAIDSNGALFSYTDAKTINSNETLDISLSSTTDAALTSYLDSL